jgi:pimeloyl-ACP methyl ester carboxylesterase
MTAWVWLGLALVWLAAIVGLRWLRRELTPERLAHPELETPTADTPWVRIPTANGKELAAQWLPATGAACARGTVVLMHGWGGNGSQLRPAADVLRRDGWAVLLPDARSHGRSDGDTYSSLPRFAEDLDACLAWLHSQRSEPTELTPVILLGHSLGAAATLLSASRRSDIHAVVSVSSFAHPEQVMRRWLATYRIPFWPLGWAVNRYIESVIGHRFDDIAPVSTVARIQCPVLLVHGEQDDLVPLGCARQLQAAAQSSHTSLATLLVVAGRHDRFNDEASLNEHVRAWLQKHAQVAARPGTQPPNTARLPGRAGRVLPQCSDRMLG